MIVTGDYMKTVFKYPLRLIDTQDVSMPDDAEILCVQIQNEVPTIWAKVDDENGPVTRKFRIAGTGHDLKGDELAYIGTFQLHAGALVFHVFEII
jgi:hypothetical protein